MSIEAPNNAIDPEMRAIMADPTPSLARELPDAPTADLQSPAIALPASEAAVAPVAGFFNRAILYEDLLKWFLLLSCLDILFTWVVLHMGGSEVNWIARLFLEHGDLYGLVAFKFTMVVLIILLCDFVGRRNDARGKFIAKAAVVITSFPVILASMQLLIFMYA